uniref:Transcriptional regulator, GntR family with aminotransferase domain n=1 Tax=Nitratidesulfovibrio vulgaris (strain DSM 19637 / Miyazaki F) TaxID=883 RepID=B8DMK9_NITV9
MFILNHEDSAPLYVQLYTQIRDRVLTGELPAGTRLPSVRHLADELGVSRNTVDTAYLELIAEGFLLTRPRSGFFVAPVERHQAFRAGMPTTPAAAGAGPRRHPTTSDALGGSGTAGILGTPDVTGAAHDRMHNRTHGGAHDRMHGAAAPSPYRFDFHPARLDPASFPLPLWRAYTLECLREAPRELSEYNHPQGDPELRRAIGDYLQRSRGVVCTPDRVIVCAGLQHSLEIVADIMMHASPNAGAGAVAGAVAGANPARPLVVGVENPGYPLPRAVFRNRGIPVVPVPVGPEGMDVDALAQSRCTLAYVTPSHQFPLGHVMPVRNRLRLIQWANAGGNVIIEDDYDSELRYAGTPVPCMQGLHPGDAGRQAGPDNPAGPAGPAGSDKPNGQDSPDGLDGAVVYTGTFSKILSPALRMSYMVLPPALLQVYRQRHRHHHAMVPLLEQRVLARFMARGHWDRHVRRMRTVYRQRHDAMLRAIDTHFGGRATVIGQGAGLHVVVRLHGTDADERELALRAGRAGIRLLPFSETRLTDNPEAFRGGPPASPPASAPHGYGNTSNDGPLLLLGFGGMPPDELEQGVAQLHRACFPRAR